MYVGDLRMMFLDGGGDPHNLFCQLGAIGPRLKLLNTSQVYRCAPKDKSTQADAPLGRTPQPVGLDAVLCCVCWGPAFVGVGRMLL